MKTELANYLNGQTEILKAQQRDEQKAPKPPTKVEQLYGLICHASCITVDNSPLLNSWEESDIIDEGDNEVIKFNWSDGEGLDYSVAITEDGLEGADFDRHNLKLKDSKGYHTVISLYNLAPVIITKTW